MWLVLLPPSGRFPYSAPAQPSTFQYCVQTTPLSSLLGAAADLISASAVLSSVPVSPSRNRQGPLPITCSQSCSRHVPLTELGGKDATPELPTEEGKEQETEPPTRKVKAERRRRATDCYSELTRAWENPQKPCPCT